VFVLGNLWLVALLFAAAAVFLVVKEILIKDKRLSLVLTVFTTLLALLAADWIRGTLLLLLFEAARRFGTP